MYLFKLIDCLVQGILILGGVVVCCSFKMLSTECIGAYIVVGSWQLINVWVHAVNYRPAVKYRARRIYLVSLAILTAIVVPLLMTDMVLLALMGLLMGSTGLAFLYLGTCIAETEQLMRERKETSAE
ncbi:hypothetical protein [Paraflavitalea pollutisoli]|uniref:hypothetical protein n=1 Tax=Paraflavitalea pollutisoli TaxID=3034143 RepID=UPI0023ED914E|nr:hypothetical protein [Paraflavitalea sp. H1-2-19X]